MGTCLAILVLFAVAGCGERPTADGDLGPAADIPLEQPPSATPTAPSTGLASEAGDDAGNRSAGTATDRSAGTATDRGAGTATDRGAGTATQGPANSVEAPAQRPSPEPVAKRKAQIEADARCPAGMVAIPGGVYEVGEPDPHIIKSYNLSIKPISFWSLAIPRTRVVIAHPFCIARYPGHGLPGKPWLPGGVSEDDLPKIETQLQGTGRSLCTLEQLLVAAAGPDNNRYPYGQDPTMNVCDTDPDRPTRPIGGFPGCVNAFGIHDFQVRASWCRLDKLSWRLLKATRVNLSPLGPIRYVVWGGNARYGEAFHPSSNFAVHGHPGTDFRYPDDDIRLCAPVGRPKREEDARMRRLADRWIEQGQYVVP